MQRSIWGRDVYYWSKHRRTGIPLGIKDVPTYQPVARLRLGSRLPKAWFALRNQDASPQWRSAWPQWFRGHFRARPYHSVWDSVCSSPFSIDTTMILVVCGFPRQTFSPDITGQSSLQRTVILPGKQYKVEKLEGACFYIRARSFSQTAVCLKWGFALNYWWDNGQVSQTFWTPSSICK